MNGLTALSIILDGDNAWPDLRKLGYTRGRLVGVAALPNGTVGGKPSVTLRIELDPIEGRSDRSIVLAETTMALFLTAAAAFRARYGDPD